MSGEAYGHREAQRVNKSLADDPKALDWAEHVRRVSRDSAAKQPRRVQYPSLGGVVKVIGDER
jgi:hypothetical protein